MLTAPGFTTSSSPAVASWPSEAARTVKEEVPATLGVPERTPSWLNEMPEGRLPDVRLQVTAPTPPVAVRVAL